MALTCAATKRESTALMAVSSGAAGAKAHPAATIAAAELDALFKFSRASVRPPNKTSMATCQGGKGGSQKLSLLRSPSSMSPMLVSSQVRNCMGLAMLRTGTLRLCDAARRCMSTDPLVVDVSGSSKLVFWYRPRPCPSLQICRLATTILVSTVTLLPSWGWLARLRCNSGRSFCFCCRSLLLCMLAAFHLSESLAV